MSEEHLFKEVLADALKKYNFKKEKYGNSWEKMCYADLDNKLKEEFDEYNFSYSIKEHYDELLDIINVCFMLANKLRRQAKRLGGESEVELNSFDYLMF